MRARKAKRIASRKESGIVNIELLMPYVLDEGVVEMAVERYAPFVRPSTQLHGTDLSDAVPIEVTPENTPELVVERALRAQDRGADACIIDCCYEAGLEESRAVLRIPIVGAGEAAMHLAYGLRSSFAVLTSDRKGFTVIPHNAERYGFASRLASVVSIDLAWEEIPDRPEEALRRVEEEALKLPSSVRTVILGCTELGPLSRSVHDRLAKQGREFHVVNPVGAAVGFAEMRVALDV